MQLTLEQPNFCQQLNAVRNMGHILHWVQLQSMYLAGVSSLGVPADQLTLSQPGGGLDYAHHIILAPPDF